MIITLNIIHYMFWCVTLKEKMKKKWESIEMMSQLKVSFNPFDKE